MSYKIANCVSTPVDEVGLVWIPDFQRLLIGEAAQRFGQVDKISIHPEWWHLK